MGEINPEQIDKEVLPFLSPSARADVRCIAMEYFVGLTGSKEGRTFIASNKKYLSAIVSLIDDDQEPSSKDAYLALVNLSTESDISGKLLNLEEHPNVILKLLEYVIRKDSVYADIACSLLSNLSRSESCAYVIVGIMIKHKDTVGFDKLVFAFCQVNYNPKNKLHYLGQVLSNLTQIREAREKIMDKKRFVIQRLLPFLEFKDSITRRGGIAAAIKNCCFEVRFHEWLVSDEVDILPRLLLPLAGPEEFDDEDNEKLPDDLQYLEPDKERESDPDIRKMLVEAINQLCAQKKCRLYIKEKNTYIIMRELHNSEKDPEARFAIENLIQLLIGDEPEPGMENLLEVEIPPEVETKLEKALEEEQKSISEETETLKLEEFKKESEHDQESKPEMAIDTVK